MDKACKQRIRAVISSLENDSLLVTDPGDLFYLTGVELEGFWLLLARKKAYALSPVMLAGQLRPLIDGIPVLVSDSMAEQASLLAKKISLKNVGIDPFKITVAVAERLKKEKLHIKSINNVISLNRSIKDKKEIEIIRRSCKISANAVRYIGRYVRPGISESEISFKIEEYFARNGARPAFLPIVASGPNTAFPHHVSGSRKLTKNDIIMIDLGCRINGYCSDLTRTTFLGKISRSQKRIYELVAQAHDRAIQGLAAGRKASEIDAVARAVIARAGFGEQFIHSTGHGVGIDVHEQPRLSARDTTVLEPGMVVTVEPGIYVPGNCGVRIEDTVLITHKGIEVLTR